MRLPKNKEYEMAIKIAGEVEKSFLNSTKLTKKELRNIAKQAALSSNEIKHSFSSGMKEVAPIFDGIERSGKKAFKTIASAAKVTSVAIAAVAGASIAVGSEFEAQMSTIKAISGATQSDFEALKEKAEEMGATTSFSATQSGQAMEYMAMAGWKTKDMLNGIEGIMDLAAASGEDLASTSDIVTDSITAFGKTAKDSGVFADVMAAASSNANTNVSLMGETFQYVGAVAGAMKYSIQDLAVATGLMANSGIKGGDAGTALRSMITRMAKPTEESSIAMKALNMSLTDGNGNMKTFATIMNDMRQGMSSMTEDQKASYAAMLGGKTAMSGLLAIVNASEADYEKLTNAIQNSSGAAKEMANIRLDNLKGDAIILKSGLEGLGIQIQDDLNTPLRSGVQWITQMVGKLSTKLKNDNIIANIVSSAQKGLPTAIRETKEFTKALYDFSEPFLAIGGWLIKHPDVIETSFISMGSALITYKAASGVMSLATSFGKLAGILTNPFAVTILAVTAAIGGAAGIGYAIKKCAKEAKKANLAKHFGDISLSLKDLEEVANYIVSNDNLGQVREAIGAFEELEGIQDTISDTMEAIKRANWKVSIGMELNTEEQSEYQEQIQSYISGVQSYVEQKQYAVNLAVGVLTDDDLEGSNIVNQVNSFYTGKQKELSDLGTKLNQTITDAFQDGLLDMDEVNKITQLQKQMAKIQSAVAGNNFDANLDLLKIKYSGGELDAETFQNLQADIQKQIDAAISDYDQAFAQSASASKTMFDDGKINQEEYNAQMAEFKENYLEQVGDIQLKASSFQTDTIMQQYADELSTALPELQNTITNTMNEYASDGIKQQFENNTASTLEAMVKQISNNNNLDSSTQAALSELYNDLLPNIESLENLKSKCKEFGVQIPNSVTEGIHSAQTIGALAGSKEAVWSVLGESMTQSEEYRILIDTLQEQGNYIPETIANAMSENREPIKEGSAILYRNVNEDLKTLFSPGFNINVPVNLNYKTNNTGIPNYALKNPYSDLGGHATGGIFNVPHIAWFAEDGPEAAIPLDGSQKAISLWGMVGKILGVYGEYGNQSSEDSFSTLSAGLDQSTETTTNNNQSDAQITYSPTLQFYGSTPSKEDIVEAGRVSQDEFNEMMQQYMKDNGRLCFQ
jgi:TP901 family phage tail tape measure protein